MWAYVTHFMSSLDGYGKIMWARIEQTYTFLGAGSFSCILEKETKIVQGKI